MGGVGLEVEVQVTHRTFSKTYFGDVLINRSGLFEFKASDAIHPRHRGQLLNYPVSYTHLTLPTIYSV